MACTCFLTSFNKAGSSDGIDNEFVVVLDAGHGGHDPGNLGNGYLEKNIALNIVLRVGEVLKEHPDIKVIYTRKDDSFVDLYVRGEIANKANADLFVSVHCDSHNSDANGAGTFVLGLHANEQNFEIAKKENSAIYLEDNYETRYAQYNINSPESIIGLTIMQEEFLDQSIMLAKMMQDNFSTRLRRNDRKVKQAGFIVLHQTFMPSVLVETGFLTNKPEGSYLNSKKGQTEMGKAIADAILKYKENVRTSVSEATGGAEIASVAPPKEEPLPANQEVQGAGKDEINEGITESTDTPDAPPKQEPPSKEEVALVDKELNTPEIVEKEALQIIEELPQRQGPPAKEEVAAVEMEVNKPPPAQSEISEQGNGTPEIAKKSGDVTKEPLVVTVADKREIPEEAVVKEPVKQAESEANAAEKTDARPKADIHFKVQLLASSRDLPLRAEDFHGLNRLSKEPYKNLYRYLYGDTNSFIEVKLLLENAHVKGYATAFIVAYKDGERIPVPEAVKYLSD
ncbi:MAG TPA: N-acetylmuramoyl-L-alanine amidase [Eudoraea sp.]|nr:N-acetylmuramoyl-L-alanine amidase [Eudoraea sp.]